MGSRHRSAIPPGAPPPDTTAYPNPRLAMPVKRNASGIRISIGERETDLRESMREVARGCESVTRAARALGVSHRTAASLRGPRRLHAKDRAVIHRARVSP